MKALISHELLKQLPAQAPSSTHLEGWTWTRRFRDNDEDAAKGKKKTTAKKKTRLLLVPRAPVYEELVHLQCTVHTAGPPGGWGGGHQRP